MQIGSGNNRLPGSAPAAGEPVPPSLPVEPAPEVPAEQDLSGNAEAPRTNWKALLLLALLLSAAAGAFFLTRYCRFGLPDVKPLWTRLVAVLPGMGTGAGTAASTNGVVLTPAQRQVVLEYSPLKPINDVKRVKALARSRVEGQDDEETNQVGTAATAKAVAAPASPAGAPVPAPASAAQPASVSNPPPAHPATPSATATSKPAGSAAWPEFQITAAIGGLNSKWYARINGQLVKVGDKVDGATVTAIAPDLITLDFNGEQRSFHVGGRR